MIATTTAAAEATLPTIHRAADMTPAMSRYWNALARRLAGQKDRCGKSVDLVDPWRTNLRDLRSEYGDTHSQVYRASTGGRWGKSAQIVSL